MEPAEESPRSYPINPHAGSRTDGGNPQPVWQPTQEEWWELRRDMADIKRKVDGPEGRPGLEQRMAAVERWQVLVIGIASGISAIGGSVATWFMGDRK